MKYSYNLETKGVVFASASDLNASFKDLCAVCDAVRYLPVQYALEVLDGVINEHRPIEYRRHNKYMGSRHELHGKKGRYPIKCAKMVRNVIVNASANAVNKGENPDYMYVVHASANKTNEVLRSPPKGVRVVTAGGYGYQTIRRSNIAFAKIEIGIAAKDIDGLSARMKRVLAVTSKFEKDIEKPKGKAKKQKAQSPQAKPLATPQKAKQTETETKKPVNQTEKQTTSAEKQNKV